MDNIKEAFEKVCKDAVEAKGYYVSLIENVPFYGGPEEGGWWGKDRIVVSYKHFATEAAAQLAYDAVKKLAKKMSNEAKKEYGRLCLQQCEYLESRGLDADDNSVFGEMDGETEYTVSMTDTVPENYYENRHYE